MTRQNVGRSEVGIQGAVVREQKRENRIENQGNREKAESKKAQTSTLIEHGWYGFCGFSRIRKQGLTLRVTPIVSEANLFEYL